jgi:RNA recognition motif-containing protein
MNILIENLDTSIDDNGLKQLFTPFGEVRSAEVVIDGFTGLSRGFGYVEMEDQPALEAIEKLNKSVQQNGAITVKAVPNKRTQLGSYKVGSGPVNEFKFKKN